MSLKALCEDRFPEEDFFDIEVFGKEVFLGIATLIPSSVQK